MMTLHPKQGIVNKCTKQQGRKRHFTFRTKSDANSISKDINTVKNAGSALVRELDSLVRAKKVVE